MHTLIVIIGGFILLAVFLIGGRFAGDLPKGALAFIPIWFILAAVNLWVGVTNAGYSLTKELPIFLLVFAIPALFAGILWWKYTSAGHR